MSWRHCARASRTTRVSPRWTSRTSVLTNSVNTAVWSNNNQPLTNATLQVFRQDLKALGKLLADEHNKHSTVNQTNIESIVNQLVTACRLTAVVAIADAQTNGIAAKLITNANEFVARGGMQRKHLRRPCAITAPPGRRLIPRNKDGNPYPSSRLATNGSGVPSPPETPGPGMSAPRCSAQEWK